MLERTYQSWVADPSGGDYPAQWLICFRYPLNGPFYGGGDAVRDRDVDGKELGPGLSAKLFHYGGACVLVKIEDGDVAAMLAQLDGCCAAEARGAGWERSVKREQKLERVLEQRACDCM